MTNLLKLLIKEEVRRYLREQKTPPPEPPTEDNTLTPDMPDMGADASADIGGTEPGADTTGAEGDLTGDGTDVPGGDGTEGGDIGGGEIGPDGEPIEDGGEGEGDEGDLGDFGGGGGFSGGGGGGGFSGGGGDDMGGDGESGGGSETSPPDAPEENPNDPVSACVNEAMKAAKLSIDPQQVLNAVKAALTVNFKSFDDAWPVVKELRKTGDKTLASVADRLTLFLAGVS